MTSVAMLFGKCGSSKQWELKTKNNYKILQVVSRIVHKTLHWGDSEAQPGPRRGLERCVASQGVTH
jgi:hypothetical protein